MKKEKITSNISKRIGIIPKPAKIDESIYGEFILTENTAIYADSELTAAKDFFVEVIQKASGFVLPTVLTPNAPIGFFFDNHIATEGYKINCTSEKLVIYASTYAGALYAVQTIRQLMQTDKYDVAGTLSMHATIIEDKPANKWRAVMLDESRWFFGKSTVLRLLDLMVFHKLNVLHWHLTDNEGWRVEIKKYPKLTEVGSIRAGTQNRAWGRSHEIDWTPHSGFYTQDDIKEIVEYAAKRNITIVPEIDIPAHFNAAIAAYPELSCKGKKINVLVRHTSSDNHIIACAGKESTYQFLYDIIDELAELFPAKYFHIGGDEAPKDYWKACPDCRKIIKEKGLLDEEELQAYFTNRIALYLKSKGKRIIGWNEILKGKNLDRSTIVQYWVNGRDKNVEEYAKSGGNIVMSKHQSFYFDMPYSMVNLKSTYEFKPENYGISSTNGSILGVEGTLWSEWIMSEKRLDFQLFPRMEALSEVAWTPENARDYKDFKQRLCEFLPVLDKMGVYYAPQKLWDRKGLVAALTTSRFISSNAHCEFYKALKLKK